ncbi:MAG: 2-hydroxyacyl-CoA dehydratase family protein [Dehalococcoidia bacterium]|nr:2-hydroxyacyl-CoA dehydratase family protein [Dehalococcoidia bacterium]
MATQTTYKVEPLETYRWAKEVRLKHFKEVMDAQAEGHMLVTGNMNAPKDLIAGIGHYVFMGGEPWAVAMAREGAKDLFLPALEAMEKQGFARDMCAFCRTFSGSMFLGQTPFGPFPKPSFVLGMNQCDSKGKWFQIVADHMQVPYYCIDFGLPNTDGTLKPNEASIKFLLTQYHEFIDWLKKFTGKPYDESRMVHALANMYKVRCLWGEVLQMQATSPSPLEYKLLLPFFLCLEYFSYKDEVVKLMTALRDETKYRVANYITPLPNEKYRVLHDGLPPWYALYLFHFLRDHGVSVVGGSNHTMFVACAQKPRPDGSFNLMDPMDWDGIPKTFDEALKWRANVEYISNMFGLDTRVRLLFAREAYRAWKGNGMIWINDRGCELFSMGILEVKAALQKDGVPCMMYESNRCDVREWSWSQVADHMDAFLEAVGVPKSEIKKDPGSKLGEKE